MLEEILTKEEGKTLEFKENTRSLQKIVQTLIAFANTAGGTLVIGIRDKTKEVVGLENISLEEEKIACAIADMISPLLLPTFHFYTWRGKDVLIIMVSHCYGPYFLSKKGLEGGTIVRLGSTNRLADTHTIQEILRLKNNKYFDEQPNLECPLENIRFDLAQEIFEKKKKLTNSAAESLGLIVQHQGQPHPSNGAVLLFAKQPKEFFPDAIIRLGRFAGTSKAEIIDQQDLEIPLAIAIDPITMFIRRHTSTSGKIQEIRRKDIPQYPVIAVREAVINSLLHTDYSIKGASINVAIFDDRIEITNPGALPLGLSLEAALSGVSQLRNRVIGRIFRELELIEQWGSGLKKIVEACINQNIKLPQFEELGNFFRATIYHSSDQLIPMEKWEIQLIEYLQKYKELTPKDAQALWNVSTRTAASRLKGMSQKGLLVEIATSSFDPYKKFRLPERF